MEFHRNDRCKHGAANSALQPLAPLFWIEKVEPQNLHPMNLANSEWDPFVLLLIDAQKAFWSGDFTQSFASFPDNTVQLLNLCRLEGIEVIHIRAMFKPDKSDWMVKYKLREGIPCIEGTPGAEVLPFARETQGEKLIIKHAFDAFQNPELLRYLHLQRKRFLLTAGLVTSTCVLFTIASAAQNGFLTAIVEDCCADEVPSHEHTLNNYPFLFFRTQVNLIRSHAAKWRSDLQTLARLEESTHPN